MESFDLPAFIKTHGAHLQTGLLLLIAFTAGYQAGHLTSPYATSAPIVFQEVDGTTTVAEKGSGDTAALEGLQAAGQQLQQDPAPNPATQVAGATTSNATSQFVASVNSNLFHHTDCPAARRIKPQNQVWFNTLAEAQAAGYQPSQCVIEKLEKVQ